MPEEYPLFTPTSDDRVLAMLSHLLDHRRPRIFPPLIIWLIKKMIPRLLRDRERKGIAEFSDHVFILRVCSSYFVLSVSCCGLWDSKPGAGHHRDVRANEGKIYRYPFNFG